MLDAPSARPLGPSTRAVIPPWFLGDRVVLVGTPATLPDLRARLGAITTMPEPLAVLTLTRDCQGLLRDLSLIDTDQPISCAILCLPRACQSQATQIRTLLAQRGVRTRIFPTTEDLLLEEPPPPGTATPAAPRFDLADLIDREPYDIDRPTVSRLLCGRRVLVTGAGGSIGSEIVRIVAAFDPSLLILMERSENALFEIDRQLARSFPQVPRRALLHDVVDADATLRRCVDVRPEVVFHAAAHKHVPLMEDHPALAVENNLFGTKSIADAAVAVGASRFVLISSDKAVNPTSVMGATKRLAEMYIQGLHAGLRGGHALGHSTGGTRMAMVRFGNVLGSAGSVVPIWSAQLADGGPITVTDARMTRYFMTIHEAATLVIQAGAMIDDSEHVAPVFVLDMGRPVRVIDMARRFVRLHGYEARVVGEGDGSAGDLGTEMVERAGPSSPASRPPSPGSAQDSAPGAHAESPRLPMDIVTTGARPGEKLFEELAYGQEQIRPTAHPGINAWIGAGSRLEPGSVTRMVAEMSGVRTSIDPAAVVDTIRRHVPEMTRTQGSDPGVESAAPVPSPPRVDAAVKPARAATTRHEP